MSIPLASTELSPLGLDPNGPRVVAIGGGHGLAACLEAIQAYAGHITAVVTVGDDGGSSGRLTAGLGIPPPGDIRRCLLALTAEPSLWSELFAYRFIGSDVEGHSLGNLMLAALADLRSDFARAVDTAAELLGAVGRVVPAATRPIHLEAVVGGRRVVGQVAIAQARGGIERLDVGPADVRATPDAIAAIRAADQIVLGPGSLFTSVTAALLAPGLADAVMSASGHRVFVLNLVTQDGETFDLDGPAHIEALARVAGVTGPGTIVVSNDDLVVPDGLRRVDLPPGAEIHGWRVDRAPVADRSAEWPAHDPIGLGRALSRHV